MSSLSFMDDGFREELIEMFENGEGMVEDFFAFPFEFSDTNKTFHQGKNKKEKIKDLGLHNFEEKNVMVNRFTVEWSFESVYESFLSFLDMGMQNF